MKKEDNAINEKREINKIKEDIKNALSDFCIENNIEDIKNESQNIFSAFCMAAGKSIFIKDFFVLATKNNIKYYDLFLIDRIADFYIFFCKLNNKLCDPIDFCYLLNLDYNIISEWNITQEASTQTITDLQTLFETSYNSIEYYKKYSYSLTNSRAETITALKYAIFCKLQANRENGLKNILIAKNNPVGIISVVNHDFKWNVETIKEETKAKALLLSELPNIQALCKQDENTTE